MRRNTKLGIAAGVAVIAIAFAIWAIWSRGGVQAGPGPFAAELAECQHRVWQDLQHVPVEYLQATVWHEGNAAELKIGGRVRLQGDNGRPTIHTYACLARNGRILLVEPE